MFNFLESFKQLNTAFQESVIVVEAPWMIYIFTVLFGIVFGSFLNVVILRVPEKENLTGPSHCRTCGHKLAWYDIIPLLSWFSLGGRCRYCKAKISAQYPIIEAANGIFWLLILFLNGINIDSFIFMAMFSGLLAMSIIDFRTQEIDNGFHIFFLSLAAIHLLFHYDRWLSYVIGFFAVSLIFLAIYIISKGKAIGGGDVKLMAACGAIIGGWEIFIAMAVGCFVGSIIHIARMKISKVGHVLAMGPYLAVGIMVGAIYGQQIISWYTNISLH